MLLQPLFGVESWVVRYLVQLRYYRHLTMTNLSVCEILVADRCCTDVVAGQAAARMHAGQPSLSPSPCARQCPSRQRCHIASGERTAPRKKTWDHVEASKTYA